MQRKGIAEIGKGRIITGAVIIALALGVTVYYLFYTGRFGGGSKLKITPPARLGYEWSHLAADNNIVSDYLFGRTKKLIVAKGGDGILAASSYTIAGRLVTQEAEDSGIYMLSDQSLLLKCYVRAGDRTNAVALKEDVVKRFRLPDGSYRSYLYDDESGEGEEWTSVSSMIDWLDAMMEYYVSYGSDVDYKEIKSLASVLFDGEGRLNTEKISVAKYVESLYVSLEDTGVYSEDEEGSMEQLYGTITGESEGEELDSRETEEEIEGVLLSNINLRLIRDLENNGLIAAGAYEKALETVKNGFAGGGYPFYAYATSGAMDCGDYIYSGQNTGTIDIAHNVKTMRNLAEVGELDSVSYAEFKEQTMNSGRIYTEFVIMTGNYSGREAVNSYADGMMLAYYKGDTDLYYRLSGTLGKRVATKSTSPALYMVFREENDRYVFYARENLGTRLATS
ncbi:MAG: hypothetical protein IKG03_03115 [Clostridiales bacterium]|nr:hypothetical protein [Clostridiales bacterium]